jgi:phage-related protein
MSSSDKPLVWLHGEIHTAPFSSAARIEAGLLLRRLQRGERLALPHSRPMPVIGKRCHELRIQDEDITWRIIYGVDPDAVIILDVFSKKTQQTPKSVIDTCRDRLRRYHKLSRDWAWIRRRRTVLLRKAGGPALQPTFSG